MLDPVRRCGLTAARAERFWGQGGDQAFGIKDGFVFEHEIDGASQFDGQDRVGFEFIAAEAGLQALSQRADDMMIAFGNDSRLAKGPTEVGVAQFGAAQAFDLAGTGHGTLDQAAVGEEILDGGEAVDVADFVEDSHAEVFADARDGLEQGILTGQSSFGQAMKLLFAGGDLFIEVADHGQFIFEGQLAQGMVFGGQEFFLPGIAIGTGLFGRGAVMSQLMRVDSGQQFSAAPDKEQALTQEGPQGPFVGRINVGGRDEVGTEQVSQFFGVNAIVLVFAAVALR